MAGQLLAREEALRLAFADAQVVRESIFLTPEQLEAVKNLAGSPVESALWVRCRAIRGDSLVGVAYFDAHRVRTLPETIMITVLPDGRVGRIEVLAFDEPPEYLPRREWYNQFLERPLDPELALRRGIRPVTGATLTARATTEAVRRVLAVHQVAGPQPAGSLRPGPGPLPQRAQ